MSAFDVLRFDPVAARRLRTVMHHAGHELLGDRAAVAPLVDAASALLGTDQGAPVLALRRAHAELERLAADLGRRLTAVDTMQAEIARIEALGVRIDRWAGTDNDPRLDRLVAARADAVRALVGGDGDLADRILGHLSAGLGLVDAVALARRAAFAARVDDVMAALGVGRAAAEVRVRAIDAALQRVVDAGYQAEVATVAVTLSMTLDLDLGVALNAAHRHGADPVVALGWMAAGRAIGVDVDELLALDGLIEHFAALDTARGGAADERISDADLRHVVEHADRFSPAQVIAAEAVLAEPALRDRLDTAAANHDIVGPERFGRSTPGDRIISRSDLESFLVKARINVALADHADEIDVAAQNGGAADGFRSRADFARFLADNPDLPADVVVAAQTMLDEEWFDRTWLEEHRDELATGMAVLAGGTVMALSAGTATPVLVALVTTSGAVAAGATTVAVNRSGDAESAWDGVRANTVNGAMVGFTMAGLPASVAAVGRSSGAVRVAAVAQTTSEVTGIVAAGGADLVLGEGIEDEVKHAAGLVSDVTGLAGFGVSALEWVSWSAVGPEWIEQRVGALRPRVSRQRQHRHLIGADPADARGGYLESLDDAQEVLDAVHSGRAELLGASTGEHLLVRYEGVTGYDVNEGLGRVGAPTNMFLIKGWSKPSVVPTNPDARPAP